MTTSLNQLSLTCPVFRCLSRVSSVCTSMCTSFRSSCLLFSDRLVLLCCFDHVFLLCGLLYLRCLFRSHPSEYVMVIRRGLWSDVETREVQLFLTRSYPCFHLRSLAHHRHQRARDGGEPKGCRQKRNSSKCKHRISSSLEGRRPVSEVLPPVNCKST